MAMLGAECSECCGGWHCYECGEGFSLDCIAFATLAIQGQSSFTPLTALTTSISGCTSVVNGNVSQLIGGDTCESWYSDQLSPCIRTYMKQQIYPYDTLFTWTGPSGNVSFTASSLDDRQPSLPSDRFQTTAKLTMNFNYTDICGVAGGTTVARRYRAIISRLWESQLVYPNPTSTRWLVWHTFSSELDIWYRDITPGDIPQGGIISYQTESLGPPDISTVGARTYFVEEPRSLLSPRPPNMTATIVPRLIDPRCPPL